MDGTSTSPSAGTSRAPRRPCRGGWSLAEVLFSVAIFSLIVVISFLPFKMTRASMVLGTARIDRLENVRLEFGRMLAEIRASSSVTLASPTTLPGGATAYRAVTFTSSSGASVTYTWTPLDSNPTTEWGLQVDQKVAGSSQPGFPQTVIPKGVRDFWLQSIPAPGQPVPTGSEATTVMAYILVYPDDATRPLPDTAKAPIELGSSVTLRN